jgi:hypothetical protein
VTAAEVLSKHRYAKAACDGCCKAYGYPDRHAAHQIDALREAGYSVVELPNGEPATGITQNIWRVGNLTIETMGSAVLWPTGHKAGYDQFCNQDEHSHNGCDPEWARKLAAALLAAADAAEVS